MTPLVNRALATRLWTLASPSAQNVRVGIGWLAVAAAARPRGWHASVATIAMLVSIAVIGLIDLTTGRPYSFSVAYVLPTAAGAWYLGRLVGVTAAVFSGLTWGIADHLVRAYGLDATVWNGLVRVAVFSALAYLIDALRHFIETLRRSQVELSDLLTQREQFLSLMAHELRAPVAAIEIVATGLTDAPDLGERERRALGQLLRQARSLSSLAQGVLTASQLEAGTMELDPEPFDLGQLVAEAGEGQSRIQVRPPDVPVLVVADRAAILRAVTNLLGNALKFSGPEQPVTVSLGLEGNEAVVEVTDFGVGLAAEESDRLFQKYARIRTPATARIDGVGLGLYFTRLILMAHGGSVSVRSLGHDFGSTFMLKLPILEGAAVAPASLDPADG